MAVAPSLLYRGTLTNTNATLKTTDAVATTVVTSIIATNKTASAATFTISVNGFYFAYQMPIAAYQTVTIDVKQVTGTNINIQGLASANSTVDVSISGVVSTGPADQAWTSYTPVVTASTTSPTNWGTATGRYTQNGKLVVYTYRLICGPSFTAGSGMYYISLPVTAARAGSTPWVGGGSTYLYDSSTQNGYNGLAYLSSTTVLQIIYPLPSGTSNYIGAAAPWTWANGDEINGIFIYEAA
jgi:hypothetical protein